MADLKASASECINQRSISMRPLLSISHVTLAAVTRTHAQTAPYPPTAGGPISQRGTYLKVMGGPWMGWNGCQHCDICQCLIGCTEQKKANHIPYVVHLQGGINLNWSYAVTIVCGATRLFTAYLAYHITIF